MAAAVAFLAVLLGGACAVPNVDLREPGSLPLHKMDRHSTPGATTGEELCDPYLTCSGHGTCDRKHRCVCQEKWIGQRCELKKPADPMGAPWNPSNPQMKITRPKPFHGLLGVNRPREDRDTWAPGQTQSISWVTNSTAREMDINLYLSGAWQSRIATETRNDGFYNWTIPATQKPGCLYQVMVSTPEIEGINPIQAISDIFIIAGGDECQPYSMWADPKHKDGVPVYSYWWFAPKMNSTNETNATQEEEAAHSLSYVYSK